MRHPVRKKPKSTLRVPQAFALVGDSESWPAPVEGWDALSPEANMPPLRAIQMDNFFPQPGYIEPRNGRVVHCDLDIDGPVQSLMAFNGMSTRNLKAAQGSRIFDVSSAVPDEELTGLTNARWQHLNFTTVDGLAVLWICNGADDSRYWNGSTWTSVTLTDDAASDEIIQAAVFKRRMWLVRTGSLNPVYLAVGALSGSATEFPLDGIFTRGGYLMAIGTWSLDGGDGPDDNICFITSEGEVAVFSGTDPTSNFNLIGRYDFGPPIGRRCLLKLGGDLAVISIDGVLPLSKALLTERGAAQTVAITKNIQPVMNASAREWRDNFGWQLISYPRGTRAILNVPVIENQEQRQYVMNTVTGAWCRFLNQNGSCWEVFNEKLYMGGNDGRVYEADRSGSDAGEVIEAEVRTAYNYFNRRGQTKRFTLCQPLMTTDRRIEPGLWIDVDFQRTERQAPTSLVPSDVAKWDQAIWDVSQWPGDASPLAEWHVVSGEGFCGSMHMKVRLGISA